MIDALGTSSYKISSRFVPSSVVNTLIACDVAARVVEAGDETEIDRIVLRTRRE